MSSDTSAELSRQLFQIMKQLPKVQLLRSTDGDIKRREYDLLVFLALNLDEEHQALSVNVLSNLLQITPAGVTHLLNPLEDMDCIQRSRSHEDRRVVLVNLTDKGWQIAEKSLESVRDRLNGLIAYLGPQDSATLIHLMSKMLIYFNS